MNKSLFFFGLLITLIFSCNDSTTKSDKVIPEARALNGVWELVSFCNYGSDGKIDTIKASSNYRQIKIYTDSKIMWSRFVASDTTDWFGYGNYTNTDSTLTEALDYGSKSMNPVIREREAFNFNLVLEKEKFTQIEIGEDGNPIIAENYIRIE